MPRGGRVRRSARGVLIKWNRSIGKTVVQAILIALFAQLYGIVSPLFLRIVVDDILVTGGRTLLDTAAAGFALLALFNAGAFIVRGIVLQNLNLLLSWDMSVRVIRHMLRLPLDWFQSRKLADILNRLQGIDQVRNALAGLLGAVFDATLALISLVMLLLISPMMLLVACGALALLLGIRWAGISRALALSDAAVACAVVENGKRIETLRAIQSIKAMAGESQRESDWTNRFAEMLHASQRSAIFGTFLSGGQNVVINLMAIVAIYFGAQAILGGSMSIGMLTAALAYLGQFSQSASNVFQQIIAWRMLDVQLERLADIVLAPVEPNTDGDAANPYFAGAISARSLCFGYAASGQLFRELNVEIAAGEHVAIVGPSGVGKSTLLKLLSGLYPPERGVVLLDGQPLTAWGLHSVRRAIGFVLQDDELLLGSVADNVSFFDPRADLNFVWECLAAAGFDEDVRRMPESVHTRIGDMGSSLSGGQRQRLLLARALYRRPRILILDEATSHLDIASERAVIATLARLDITRIVVAHRPDTIAAADRVLRLADGVLVEEPNARKRRVEPA